MNTKEQKLNSFGKLLDIMEELREKCPWDKKQTFQSLRHLTLEESYELSEAILNENLKEIKKELGDILLLIVFYAKIASEKNAFDIADVINSLNEKLISRHPHIYGNETAEHEDTVKKNWETLKLQEGYLSVLEGVPKNLPSMIKAFRIQDKVKGIGFDFPSPQEAWKKVKEEFQEFYNENNDKKREEELGDIFFSLINYARICGMNPDSALEKSNQKFISRFQKMESIARNQNTKLSNLSILEMDKLWKEVKSMENNN